MRNVIRLFVFAAPWILSPVRSWAEEAVVEKRLYDLGGRLELSLNPATVSVFDKYTRHIGASLGLAYYFTDAIGLEIDGGYAYVHEERKLLDEILSVGKGSIKEIERLPLKDLRYMTWWATGGLVFSPLYGKLNLSAEFDFNFHFYVVLGAGVAEYRYHDLEWTSLVGDGEFEKVEKTVGLKPTYYFGGGLRFHFRKSWSARFEIRDQFFYDEFSAQSLATGVIAEKQITDFVHITTMRIGLCFSFF